MIKGWDCTKPGVNTLDELHRSLRDVQRLTEIWHRIAREHSDAWTTPANERAEIRRDLEHDARQNWSDWIRAIDRAHKAIDQANLAAIDMSKADLLKQVGLLNRLFPHSIMGESDGTHLLNGVHPLGAGEHGISYFPDKPVEKAFMAINEIVDVLILAAPRCIDPPTQSATVSNPETSSRPALTPSGRAYLQVLGDQPVPQHGTNLAAQTGYPDYRRPLAKLIDLGLAQKPSPRGGYEITPEGREYLEQMRP